MIRNADRFAKSRNLLSSTSPQAHKAQCARVGILTVGCPALLPVFCEEGGDFNVGCPILSRPLRKGGAFDVAPNPCHSEPVLWVRNLLPGASPSFAHFAKRVGSLTSASDSPEVCPFSRVHRINLPHNPLRPLHGSGNQRVGPRTPLQPSEQVIRSLQMPGHQNSGHNRQHAFV